MVMTPPDGHLDKIRKGYSFDGPALHLGAAMLDGEIHQDAPVRLPVAMMNRHGLVSGATGTGKTVTLQVMAEQLSAHGVPVFLADIKGDLTGLSTPAGGSDRLRTRAQSVGQDWNARSFPVEYFSLGGDGKGVPVRARISDFGPLLLARVMGLNETQESSLQLVFYYADKNDLELYNLADLRAVISFLTSDEGKDSLEALGGLSRSTAGVILRELVMLEAQGMDKFFGETEFDSAEFLRLAEDGRGVISCLELPTLLARPALFSTFLMWLIADLFAELPEVGDAEKPKLVFFLDEAHLLFRNASDAFLESITTTVRLIRSKGVGIFFVTQAPKDVPSEVLGQLANRIQHALRAFTPDDAKALRATVSTFPTSAYDLEEVLTNAGTGEAVVTVMTERGAPSPVAWTRICAPESTIGPSPAATVDSIVRESPLLPVYAPTVDSHSAFEKLSGTPAPTHDGGPGSAGKDFGIEAGATGADGSGTSGGTGINGGSVPRTQADIDAEARRIEEAILGRPSSRQATRTPAPLPDWRPMPGAGQQRQPEHRESRRPGPGQSAPERRNPERQPPERSTPERHTQGHSGKPGKKDDTADLIKDVAVEAATVLGRELVRGLFGTRRRRRRW
ncbi:helicase HerA-like domain-containing protein [Crystallibacter degradans]|uniref:helicase HerA-like domain-containing protein n=1 Tax=Crystallibacter degradans TaxID=2726743 RepID=UPI001F0DBCE5|nr:helicase HerA-like domain-containing protein [Arthrobacter sp. SF27]